VPTTRSRRTTTPSSPSFPTTPQPHLPNQPPWLEHPTLSGLRDRLQLVYDCWTLLELPDGTSRRPLYLPRGIEEPETCYSERLEAARPTGFYRDALRTYAGMLSRLAWQELPDSLSQVATDVDGQGTDLGVFLFLADLLTLRDGGCLILQLPPSTAGPQKATGWKPSPRVTGSRCPVCNWCPGETCSTGACLPTTPRLLRHRGQWRSSGGSRAVRPCRPVTPLAMQRCPRC
jgi:hypothetical protein